MFGFWGKSIHGNKGVNSAGLALIAGQFFNLCPLKEAIGNYGHMKVEHVPVTRKENLCPSEEESIMTMTRRRNMCPKETIKNMKLSRF